jgi:hypothetical protein
MDSAAFICFEKSGLQMKTETYPLQQIIFQCLPVNHPKIHTNPYIRI